MSLEEGCEDLITLCEVNDDTILQTIGKRFSSKSIYTSIGTVLLAVNPFERIPNLIGNEVLNSYHHTLLNEEKKLNSHVYMIPSAAYGALCTKGKNQSILISGESGAGKTEAAKVCLSYLTSMSGSVESVDDGNRSAIGDRIVASSPILEAFGNAQTIRNPNSSRFGKWMELSFDAKNAVCGSKIVSYLLEKSRVTQRDALERNYHVFYQLLRGASEQQLVDWKLTRDPNAYDFLVAKNHSEDGGVATPAPVPVKDLNDATIFTEETLPAFREMNFEPSVIDDILKVIAGILHLGNVVFQTDDSDSEFCKIVPETLGNVASVLSCTTESMEHGLSNRSIVTGSAGRSSVTTIRLNEKKAIEGRDSLARTLYNRLFLYIVEKINESSGVSSSGGIGYSADSKVVGLLDIFGFEIFQVNSFEQVCINYCNEMLQNHFNYVIFTLEKALYADEGIECDNIECQDNSLVISSIASTFKALDEESRIPKGSSKSWYDKMKRAANPPPGTKNTASATPSSIIFPKTAHADRFVVKHYAGEVSYSPSGFMEKNTETIHNDLTTLMKNSDNSLIRTLFPPDTPAAAADSPRKGGTPATKSISWNFQSQLKNLIELLQTTESHFIRCIKSNDACKALIFDKELVRRQLVYSGVFEVVKIQQSGLPIRWLNGNFLTRFKCLAPSGIRYGFKHVSGLVEYLKGCEQTTEVKSADDDGSSVSSMISKFYFQLDSLKVGKTMTFYTGVEQKLLEFHRSSLHIVCSSLITRWMRMVAERNTFRHFRKSYRLFNAGVTHLNKDSNRDIFNGYISECEKYGNKFEKLCGVGTLSGELLKMKAQFILVCEQLDVLALLSPYVAKSSAAGKEDYSLIVPENGSAMDELVKSLQVTVDRGIAASLEKHPMVEECSVSIKQYALACKTLKNLEEIDSEHQKATENKAPPTTMSFDDMADGIIAMEKYMTILPPTAVDTLVDVRERIETHRKLIKEFIDTATSLLRLEFVCFSRQDQNSSMDEFCHFGLTCSPTDNHAEIVKKTLAEFLEETDIAALASDNCQLLFNVCKEIDGLRRALLVCPVDAKLDATAKTKFGEEESDIDSICSLLASDTLTGYAESVGNYVYISSCAVTLKSPPPSLFNEVYVSGSMMKEFKKIDSVDGPNLLEWEWIVKMQLLVANQWTYLQTCVNMLKSLAQHEIIPWSDYVDAENISKEEKMEHKHSVNCNELIILCTQLKNILAIKNIRTIVPEVISVVVSFGVKYAQLRQTFFFCDWPAFQKLIVPIVDPSHPEAASFILEKFLLSVVPTGSTLPADSLDFVQHHLPVLVDELSAAVWHGNYHLVWRLLFSTVLNKPIFQPTLMENGYINYSLESDNSSTVQSLLEESTELLHTALLIQCINVDDSLAPGRTSKNFVLDYELCEAIIVLQENILLRRDYHEMEECLMKCNSMWFDAKKRWNVATDDQQPVQFSPSAVAADGSETIDILGAEFRSCQSLFECMATEMEFDQTVLMPLQMDIGGYSGNDPSVEKAALSDALFTFGASSSDLDDYILRLQGVSGDIDNIADRIHRCCKENNNFHKLSNKVRIAEFMICGCELLQKSNEYSYATTMTDTSVSLVSITPPLERRTFLEGLITLAEKMQEAISSFSTVTGGSVGVNHVWDSPLATSLKFMTYSSALLVQVNELKEQLLTRKVFVEFDVYFQHRVFVGFVGDISAYENTMQDPLSVDEYYQQCSADVLALRRRRGVDKLDGILDSVQSVALSICDFSVKFIALRDFVLSDSVRGVVMANLCSNSNFILQLEEHADICRALLSSTDFSVALSSSPCITYLKEQLQLACSHLEFSILCSELKKYVMWLQDLSCGRDVSGFVSVSSYIESVLSFRKKIQEKYIYCAVLNEKVKADVNSFIDIVDIIITGFGMIADNSYDESVHFVVSIQNLMVEFSTQGLKELADRLYSCVYSRCALNIYVEEIDKIEFDSEVNHTLSADSTRKLSTAMRKHKTFCKKYLIKNPVSVSDSISSSQYSFGGGEVICQWMEYWIPLVEKSVSVMALLCDLAFQEYSVIEEMSLELVEQIAGCPMLSLKHSESKEKEPVEHKVEQKLLELISSVSDHCLALVASKKSDAKLKLLQDTCPLRLKFRFRSLDQDEEKCHDSKQDEKRQLLLGQLVSLPSLAISSVGSVVVESLNATEYAPAQLLQAHELVESRTKMATAFSSKYVEGLDISGASKDNEISGVAVQTDPAKTTAEVIKEGNIMPLAQELNLFNSAPEAIQLYHNLVRVSLLPIISSPKRADSDKFYCHQLNVESQHFKEQSSLLARFNMGNNLTTERSAQDFYAACVNAMSSAASDVQMMIMGMLYWMHVVVGRITLFQNHLQEKKSKILTQEHYVLLDAPLDADVVQLVEIFVSECAESTIVGALNLFQQYYPAVFSSGVETAHLNDVDMKCTECFGRQIVVIEEWLTVREVCSKVYHGTVLLEKETLLQTLFDEECLAGLPACFRSDSKVSVNVSRNIYFGELSRCVSALRIVKDICWAHALSLNDECMVFVADLTASLKLNDEVSSSDDDSRRNGDVVLHIVHTFYKQIKQWLDFLNVRLTNSAATVQVVEQKGAVYTSERGGISDISDIEALAPLIMLPPVDIVMDNDSSSDTSATLMDYMKTIEMVVGTEVSVASYELPLAQYNAVRANVGRNRLYLESWRKVKDEVSRFLHLITCCSGDSLVHNSGGKLSKASGGMQEFWQILQSIAKIEDQEQAATEHSDVHLRAGLTLNAYWRVLIDGDHFSLDVYGIKETDNGSKLLQLLSVIKDMFEVFRSFQVQDLETLSAGVRGSEIETAINTALQRLCTFDQRKQNVFTAELESNIYRAERLLYAINQCLDVSVAWKKLADDSFDFSIYQPWSLEFFKRSDVQREISTLVNRTSDFYNVHGSLCSELLNSSAQLLKLTNWIDTNMCNLSLVSPERHGLLAAIEAEKTNGSFVSAWKLFSFWNTSSTGDKRTHFPLSIQTVHLMHCVNDFYISAVMMMVKFIRISCSFVTAPTSLSCESEEEKCDREKRCGELEIVAKDCRQLLDYYYGLSLVFKSSEYGNLAGAVKRICFVEMLSILFADSQFYEGKHNRASFILSIRSMCTIDGSAPLDKDITTMHNWEIFYLYFELAVTHWSWSCRRQLAVIQRCETIVNTDSFSSVEKLELNSSHLEKSEDEDLYLCQLQDKMILLEQYFPVSFDVCRCLEDSMMRWDALLVQDVFPFNDAAKSMDYDLQRLTASKFHAVKRFSPANQTIQSLKDELSDAMQLFFMLPMGDGEDPPLTHLMGKLEGCSKELKWHKDYSSLLSVVSDWNNVKCAFLAVWNVVAESEEGDSAEVVLKKGFTFPCSSFEVSSVFHDKVTAELFNFRFQLFSCMKWGMAFMMTDIRVEGDSLLNITHDDTTNISMSSTHSLAISNMYQAFYGDKQTSQFEEMLSRQNTYEHSMQHIISRVSAGGVSVKTDSSENNELNRTVGAAFSSHLMVKYYALLLEHYEKWKLLSSWRRLSSRVPSIVIGAFEKDFENHLTSVNSFLWSLDKAMDKGGSNAVAPEWILGNGKDWSDVFNSMKTDITGKRILWMGEYIKIMGHDAFTPALSGHCNDMDYNRVEDISTVKLESILKYSKSCKFHAIVSECGYNTEFAALSEEVDAVLTQVEFAHRLRTAVRSGRWFPIDEGDHSECVDTLVKEYYEKRCSFSCNEHMPSVVFADFNVISSILMNKRIMSRMSTMLQNSRAAYECTPMIVKDFLQSFCGSSLYFTPAVGTDDPQEGKNKSIAETKACDEIIQSLPSSVYLSIENCKSVLLGLNSTRELEWSTHWQAVVDQVAIILDLLLAAEVDTVFSCNLLQKRGGANAISDSRVSNISEEPMVKIGFTEHDSEIQQTVENIVQSALGSEGIAANISVVSTDSGTSDASSVVDVENVQGSRSMLYRRMHFIFKQFIECVLGVDAAVVPSALFEENGRVFLNENRDCYVDMAMTRHTLKDCLESISLDEHSTVVGVKDLLDLPETLQLSLPEILNQSASWILKNMTHMCQPILRTVSHSSDLYHSIKANSSFDDAGAIRLWLEVPTAAFYTETLICARKKDIIVQYLSLEHCKLEVMKKHLRAAVTKAGAYDNTSNPDHELRLLLDLWHVDSLQVLFTQVNHDFSNSVLSMDMENNLDSLRSSYDENSLLFRETLTRIIDIYPTARQARLNAALLQVIATHIDMSSDFAANHMSNQVVDNSAGRIFNRMVRTCVLQYYATYKFDLKHEGDPMKLVPASVIIGWLNVFIHSSSPNYEMNKFVSCLLRYIKFVLMNEKFGNVLKNIITDSLCYAIVDEKERCKGYADDVSAWEDYHDKNVTGKVVSREHVRSDISKSVFQLELLVEELNVLNRMEGYNSDWISFGLLTSLCQWIIAFLGHVVDDNWSEMNKQIELFQSMSDWCAHPQYALCALLCHLGRRVERHNYLMEQLEGQLCSDVTLSDDTATGQNSQHTVEHYFAFVDFDILVKALNNNEVPKKTSTIVPFGAKKVATLETLQPLQSEEFDDMRFLGNFVLRLRTAIIGSKWTHQSHRSNSIVATPKRRTIGINNVSMLLDDTWKQEEDAAFAKDEQDPSCIGYILAREKPSIGQFFPKCILLETLRVEKAYYNRKVERQLVFGLSHGNEYIRTGNFKFVDCKRLKEALHIASSMQRLSKNSTLLFNSARDVLNLRTGVMNACWSTIRSSLDDMDRAEKHAMDARGHWLAEEDDGGVHHRHHALMLPVTVAIEATEEVNTLRRLSDENLSMHRVISDSLCTCKVSGVFTKLEICDVEIEPILNALRDTSEFARISVDDHNLIYVAVSIKDVRLALVMGDYEKLSRDMQNINMRLVMGSAGAQELMLVKSAMEFGSKIKRIQYLLLHHKVRGQPSALETYHITLVELDNLINSISLDDCFEDTSFLLENAKAINLLRSAMKGGHWEVEKVARTILECIRYRRVHQFDRDYEVDDVKGRHKAINVKGTQCDSEVFGRASALYEVTNADGSDLTSLVKVHETDIGNNRQTRRNSLIEFDKNVKELGLQSSLSLSNAWKAHSETKAKAAAGNIIPKNEKLKSSKSGDGDNIESGVNIEYSDIRGQTMHVSQLVGSASSDDPYSVPAILGNWPSYPDVLDEVVEEWTLARDELYHRVVCHVFKQYLRWTSVTEVSPVHEEGAVQAEIEVEIRDALEIASHLGLKSHESARLFHTCLLISKLRNAKENGLTHDIFTVLSGVNILKTKGLFDASASAEIEECFYSTCNEITKQEIVAALLTPHPNVPPAEIAAERAQFAEDGAEIMALQQDFVESASAALDADLENHDIAVTVPVEEEGKVVTPNDESNLPKSPGRRLFQKYTKKLQRSVRGNFYSDKLLERQQQQEEEEDAVQLDPLLPFDGAVSAEASVAEQMVSPLAAISKHDTISKWESILNLKRLLVNSGEVVAPDAALRQLIALMSEVISLQCACSSGVLDKIEKALLCARLYAEREDAFLSTNRPLARRLNKEIKLAVNQIEALSVMDRNVTRSVDVAASKDVLERSSANADFESDEDETEGEFEEKRYLEQSRKFQMSVSTELTDKKEDVSYTEELTVDMLNETGSESLGGDLQTLLSNAIELIKVVTVKSRQQGSPCIFTARIRVRRSGQLYCTLAKLASMSQPCDVHYRVTINVLLALLDDMLDAYVPAAQTTTRIVAEDLTPFCRVPLKLLTVACTVLKEWLSVEVANKSPSFVSSSMTLTNGNVAEDSTIIIRKGRRESTRCHPTASQTDQVLRNAHSTVSAFLHEVSRVAKPAVGLLRPTAQPGDHGAARLTHVQQLVLEFSELLNHAPIVRFARILLCRP